MKKKLHSTFPANTVYAIAIFSVIIFSAGSTFSQVITVDEQFESQAIGKYIAIFEDYGRSLTIDDLLQDSSASFVPQHNDKLVVGHRRDAHIWVRAVINNKANTSQSVILRMGDTFTRYLTCYVAKEGTELLATYQGGLQNSFHDRIIPHRTSAFPITIDPHDRVTIFLKIDGKWDPVFMTITLHSASHFYKQSLWEYGWSGVFTGILIMVILVALVLYISTRLKLFLYYFLYTFTISLLSFSIYGFDFQYIYPNQPIVAHHIKLWLGILSSLALLVLVIEYYKNEKEDIRFIQQVFKVVLPLSLLSLVFITFQDRIRALGYEENTGFNFFPMIFVGGVSLLIVFSLFRITLRNPKWNNVLFLTGFLGITLLGSISIILNNGVIQLPFDPLRASILLELTCLSILMVHKIYSLRTEKLQLDVEIQTARMEKEQADKRKELNQAKTRLYTNITHEFRTPLTVIQGLTGQLEGNEEKKEIIQRNSHILLRLINQMLTLSKADKGELRLHLVQDDIIQYIQYLSESFQSWGATKNIRLHFLPETPQCVMDYDPEKLQDILSNLLSNAIKHTPEGGDVYVILKKIEDHLSILIKDTGRGIEEQYIPHIFDRFYQVDQTETRDTTGSGIGLAICKELTTLMNGTISVESQPGVGSTFTLQIPITQEAPRPSEKEIPSKPSISADIIPDIHAPALLEQTFPTLPVADNKRPTILVVEDNADVRHYIALCLEKRYQLIMAKNGKIGLQKALDYGPDLILSDIMMPDTNGLELCQTIKTNLITSHIPVILLTAKADQHSKMLGLTSGADAYLSKPFDKEELLIRISSLIEQRQRIRDHFLQGTYHIESQKYQVEQQFLKEIKTLVKAHLLNELFDVQRLAREIGMSRSQIYRKVKALTGRSIASYIRYIRLQEGKRLLETTHKSISEVAYDVGFKDLSYFSSSFSQEFGYPPHATRK